MIRLLFETAPSIPAEALSCLEAAFAAAPPKGPVAVATRLRLAQVNTQLIVCC